jgi:glycosyltransferase involved in cell wall biosynthesis
MSAATQPRSSSQGDPLVSIIMPTFDHEEFIHSSLRSVLAQSYESWELIVVDDASRDRTAMIVDGYMARDSRIHLIRHQTNYGVARLSETYNEALALSRGSLIAVLEGDDEWVPEKLSIQVRVFTDPSVVLCYADYDEITSDGVLITRHGVLDAVSPSRSGATENLQFFSTLTSFGSNTVMVRKDQLVEGGGFIGVGPFVDFPTWLVLVPKGDFVRIPSVLGRWRRHPGSVAYASYGHSTIDLLERHFVAYLERASEQLAVVGIDNPELEMLAVRASAVLREKQRSTSYYEGKYHLMFGKRLKAVGRFSRAIIDPRTAVRHRLGALVGIVAAATSRRLLPYCGRLARAENHIAARAYPHSGQSSCNWTDHA